MNRRFQFFLALILCFTLLLSTVVQAVAQPNDIAGHWAQDVMENMVENGVIVGYDDGTVKPDDAITRAEFVAMVNRYYGFVQTTEISFADVVDTDWYYAEIAKAKAAGYISGYVDNTFRPNNPITRQEAAVIIASIEALGAVDDTGALNQFGDADDIGQWAHSAVRALIGAQIMSGYPDETIRPEQNITRAEAASLLYKAKNRERIPEALPAIESIELQNGYFTIAFDQDVTGFSLSDVRISATLNGKDYILTALSYNPETKKVSFSPIMKTTSRQTLSVTISAREGSDKVSGSASDSVSILTLVTSGGVENTAPTTPIITRTPATGTITELTEVTITAEATDAENDEITYVWSGRTDETSTYSIGKHVVTVKAVDSHGAESEQAAVVFFVVDSATGSGGLLLTDPESRIYENGIEGATITHYTFNVPSVWGHSGSDYAWVKGLNVNTQTWEEIIFQYTSNGIYFEGDLTPGTYSRLEFFYYASHCMYGQSNITYTVEFAFVELGDEVPAEAAPEALGVSISGTTDIGDTLTGSYTYHDDNGDLEGQSTYQWYRADDATGTNKAEIAGATGTTYVVSTSDYNKYLSFEVTPVAVTGVEGTITGIGQESAAVAGPIASTDTDILSFTLAEQTGVAVIDADNYTVTIEVNPLAVVTNLTPTIVVSAGATILPASGSAQDFTNPVEYTVTAEDGVTTQIWTVTVTVLDV